MAEYIKKDELLKFKADVYDEDGHVLYAVPTGCIVAMPPADVMPVRHGRCKKSDGKDEWYTYYYTCVECGANMMVADSDYHDVSPNYCPNCGAKMDGGAD